MPISNFGFQFFEYCISWVNPSGTEEYMVIFAPSHGYFSSDWHRAPCLQLLGGPPEIWQCHPFIIQLLSLLVKIIFLSLSLSKSARSSLVSVLSLCAFTRENISIFFYLLPGPHQGSHKYRQTIKIGISSSIHDDYRLYCCIKFGPPFGFEQEEFICGLSRKHSFEHPNTMQKRQKVLQEFQHLFILVHIYKTPRNSDCRWLHVFDTP